MAFMQRLIVQNPTKELRLKAGILGSIWPLLQKSSRIDLIDAFTNELVEKKAIKWEILRENVKQSHQPAVNPPLYSEVTRAARSILHDLNGIRKPELCIDIRNLNQPQLDNIVSSILESRNTDDFVYITKQCVRYNRLPSSELLHSTLYFLGELRRTQDIQNFADICRDVNKQLFKDLVELYPFKCLSLWNNSSTDKSFQAILDGYECCSSTKGRQLLRETFRSIVAETVGNKSPAVLVALLKVAENINEKFEEVFVVANIWRYTFTSEWFSDQQLSNELFDKHEPIRAMVAKRSSTLCYSLLQQHDVNSVHRLIELLLKYDYKDGCSHCLSILFDYQYWQKDLRACSEIMQNSLDLDLPLSKLQTEKLLNLLLNRPSQHYKPKQLPIKKFQYKF